MKKKSLCRLALVLRFPTFADTIQKTLTVLVQLQLGDDDFRGSDANGDALAVGLLADNSLDVYHIFQSVDTGDLALTAFVRSSNDGDFIIFADGDGADVVLLAQLFAQRSAHDCPTLAGGSREVRLARLPS